MNKNPRFWLYDGMAYTNEANWQTVERYRRKPLISVQNTLFLFKTTTVNS